MSLACFIFTLGCLLMQTIALFVVVFVDIFPLLTGNRDMDEFVYAESDCISIAQVSWQVEGIKNLLLHSI